MPSEGGEGDHAGGAHVATLSSDPSDGMELGAPLTGAAKSSGRPSGGAAGGGAPVSISPATTTTTTSTAAASSSSSAKVPPISLAGVQSAAALQDVGAGAEPSPSARKGFLQQMTEAWGKVNESMGRACADTKPKTLNMFMMPCCCSASTDDTYLTTEIDDGRGYHTSRQLEGARVYQVVLPVDPKSKLGVDLEYLPDREVIPIKEVTGNLFAEWNRQQTSLRVIRGDRIVAVNSARGRAEDMMRELRRSSKPDLTITLVRVSNWKAVQDEEFVFAFDSLTCLTKDNVWRLGGESGPEHGAPVAKTSSRGEEPLPRPWIAVWSKSQKKYYYYNEETKQSRWNRPSIVEPNGLSHMSTSVAFGTTSTVMFPVDEGGASGSTAIGRGMTTDSAEEVPYPWEKVWSKTRQRWYYYNPESNEASWVHPSSVKISPRDNPALRVNSRGTDIAARATPKVSPRGVAEAEPKKSPRSPRDAGAPAKASPRGAAEGEPKKSPRSAAGSEPKKSPRSAGASAKNSPRDAVKASPRSAAEKVKPENLIGTWMYDKGSYTIMKSGGALIYKEATPGVFAIYGILEQCGEWLEGDLYDDDGSSPVPPKADNTHRGRVRVQRMGNIVLSNFKLADSDQWEHPVESSKVS